MTNHEKFLQAIYDKKVIKVIFNSHEKGEIERLCLPFDFGPSRRNLKVNPDRYHLYDLDSPEGSHTLSILPKKLITIEIMNQSFDPAKYITWTPKWFIQRDWGNFS
jgi:hypothetical protein